jgi:hypothetical protein
MTNTVETLNNTSNDNLVVIGYTTGDKPRNTGINRLAKITFKTDKATGIKPASKAVEIALFKPNEIRENIDLLIPAISTMLEGVQDSIIREHIENDKSFIAKSELTIGALVAYMQAESKGERLSKVFLANWFDSELLEPLTLAIASKVSPNGEPNEQQLKVINDTIEAYKTNISKLASPNLNFADEVKAMLIKALGFAGENTIAKALIAKLENVVKPQVQLMAL